MGHPMESFIFVFVCYLAQIYLLLNKDSLHDFSRGPTGSMFSQKCLLFRCCRFILHFDYCCDSVVLSFKGNPMIKNNNPDTMHKWSYICLDILPL